MLTHAADFIKEKINNKYVPKIALILGSGLGALADEIENSVKIKYHEIPSFKQSSIDGHVGQLVIGKLQNKEVLERILQSGILVQYNADAFASIISKRKAISLLKKGNIHFIGSDCHNMTSRPPQIKKAFEVIQKKLGEEFINQMDEFGYSLIGLNNK